MHLLISLHPKEDTELLTLELLSSLLSRFVERKLMESLKIFKTERWTTAGSNTPLGPNVVGLLLVLGIYQSLIGKIMIVSLFGQKEE